MSKGTPGRPQGPSVMPTDNDWRILREIVRAIFRTDIKVPGASPRESEAFCRVSLTDLGDATGMHPMSLRRNIHRLEERGLLRHESGTGGRPSAYYMSLRTLGAVYALLDVTVGMDGPWPSRDNYKY